MTRKIVSSRSATGSSPGATGLQPAAWLNANDALGIFPKRRDAKAQRPGREVRGDLREPVFLCILCAFASLRFFLKTLRHYSSFQLRKAAPHRPLRHRVARKTTAGRAQNRGDRSPARHPRRQRQLGAIGRFPKVHLHPATIQQDHYDTAALLLRGGKFVPRSRESLGLCSRPGGHPVAVPIRCCAGPLHH